MNEETLPLAQRITQGRVTRDQNAVDADNGDRIAIALKTWNGSPRANAELIAEAFNVTHETGKTPAQLAAENARLREALEPLAEFAAEQPDGGIGTPDWRGMAQEARKLLEP